MTTTDTATPATIEPTADELAGAVAELIRYNQDQRNAYLAHYLAARVEYWGNGNRFDRDIADVLALVRAEQQLRNTERTPAGAA